MSVSIFPVLAIIALALVGGFVAVVLLIANPKTRVVGIVLLLAAPVVLAIFGVGVLYVSLRETNHQRWVAATQHMDKAREMSALDAREAEKLREAYPVAGQSLVDAVHARAAAERLAVQWGRLKGLAPEREAAAKAAVEFMRAVDVATAQAALAQSAVEKSSGLAGALGRALLSGLTRAEPRKAPEVVAAVSHGPAKTTEAKTEPAPPTGPPQPVAADRPVWVGKPAGPMGDIYQMTMVVGPYLTREECEERLPEQLQAALSRYVRVCLGSAAAGQVEFPRSLRQQVIKGQWQETIQASFGPMIQLHVLVEFDAAVRDRLEQVWRETLITGRIWSMGIGGASVLALLGVLLAGLKIDQAAGGKRRAWLATAGVLVALAILGTAYTAMSVSAGRPMPGGVDAPPTISAEPPTITVEPPARRSGR